VYGGLENRGYAQPLVRLRSAHDAGKPSFSERRRYCRDEYDDCIASPIIEGIVVRFCMVAVVVVIGLAIWFA
jgi:hypothetical protein